MTDTWVTTVLADLRKRRARAVESLAHLDAAIKALEELDPATEVEAPPAAARAHAAKDVAHRRVYDVRPTKGRCAHAACGKPFKQSVAGKLRRYCDHNCARRARKAAIGPAALVVEQRLDALTEG